MADLVLDPYFLPFTEEELVKAEVLMGSTEPEARRAWRTVAKHLATARKRLEIGRGKAGEAVGYARLGGPDVLLRLSLVSPELESRVRHHKFGRWEQVEDQLTPESRRQLRQEKERWEEERERLRTRLQDEGKL